MFLAFEPHTGFRYVEVRERRPASDYADFRQTLLTRHYPEAQVIRLVQDNLNTHTPGAFYEVLPPAQAFALAQKFEPHYTPKQGSWLNMAEIELAALSTQCLDRRIPNLPTLRREVLAHRVKQRVRPMFGFKRFDHAAITISGIELVHQIKKQQFDLSAICPPHAGTPQVWEAVLAAA